MSVFNSPFNQVFRNPFGSPFNGGASGGVAWTPALWFLANEQGLWLDPSDFTTMFQDAAGTTPVTAVEQPVGLILDKSGRGNHASQATAASRPVLSARKNLLTKTEDFSDATWVKYACTVTANQDGIADKLVPAAASGTYKSAQSSVNMFSGAGGRFTMQCKVKDAGCGFAWLLVAGNNGRATYNLTTGAATVYGGTNASASASPVDVNGYRLLTLTADIVAEGVAWVGGIESAADPAVAYTSSGTNGILIKDVQVEYGSTATRYQRVNTNTDYDTVGFPHYLKFDGVDDFLSTASVDFTATDKMTVVAGLTKLSDAAVGVVCELGTNTNTVNGSFDLLAPGIASQASYMAELRGTTSPVGISSTGVAAPITNVLAYALDNAGSGTGVSAQIRPRVDGTPATNVSGTSAGNFGNYPLYIGRRNAAVLPFNGNLNQLIVRGTATTPADIQTGEKYVAGKTGVTLP